MPKGERNTEWVSPRRVNTRPFARETPKVERMAGVGGAAGRSWLGELLSGESRFGGREYIERPYEEAGWVHAALKAIGSAVRQCPLVLYEEDPKDNPGARRVDAPDNPLVKLLARPNNWMSPSRFIEAGVYHRKLDGEDFWFLFDEGKRPVRVDVDADGEPRFDYPAFMIPVRGGVVDMVPDKFGFPLAWRYMTPKTDTTGRRVEITAEWGGVVQFADYDPDNPLRGMGDVLVLMRELGLEHGAQRYLEAMLRNSGDPGGTILTDNPMSHDEERRAEKEAQERFSLGNTGRWHVISGKNIRYEPAKFGPKDMQFRELLEWIRNKTASVLGVPLPVLGVLDEASYSNYSTAVAQFWQNGNGVLAYMASVEDAINTQFIPRLKDTAVHGWVARFDTTHVEALRDDNQAKWELATRMAQAQIGLSFEEAAELVGLQVEPESTAFGGTAWLPPNITTAESALRNADEADGNGQEPPDAEGDDEQGFPGSADFEETEEERAMVRSEREAFEYRREYFRAFESAVLVPGERKVRKAAKDYLFAYERAQLKRLEDVAAGREHRSAEALVSKNQVSPEDIARDVGLLKSLMLDFAEWVQKLSVKIGSPLAEVFALSARDVADELSATAINTTADPAIVDMLRKQKIALSEGVNGTLAEKVRKALVRVFEKRPFEMATISQHVERALPELTESLKRVFSSRSSRASAIARTEVNRAANGVRFEAFRREGVERHEWVTSGDQFVRDKAPHSHVDLDGVVADIGSSFRGPDRVLRYPGDPVAAAGDVVNCRCVTSPKD